MKREEAINIVRKNIPHLGIGSTEMTEALKELIPELRESEDERIRRTLVEYFGPEAQLDFIRGVPIQKIRDWLEKQQEQKPAWSQEDERKLNDVICIVGKSGLITSYREHYIRFLKSLRPQPKVDSVEYERGFLAGQGSIQHWKPSEEQMDILDKVYHYLWSDRNATADMQDGLGDLIDELKKLM